jgi:hypothetical protein
MALLVPVTLRPSATLAINRHFRLGRNGLTGIIGGCSRDAPALLKKLPGRGGYDGYIGCRGGGRRRQIGTHRS